MPDRYPDRVPCYHDDIQGTAAIVLAGIAAAMNQTGGAWLTSASCSSEPGSAGVGIPKLIAAEMQTKGSTAWFAPTVAIPISVPHTKPVPRPDAQAALPGSEVMEAIKSYPI
jgi:malic enzyme